MPTRASSLGSRTHTVCTTTTTIAGRALSRRRISSCARPTITSASARAGTGGRFDSHVSSLFSYTCLRACTESPPLQINHVVVLVFDLLHCLFFLTHHTPVVHFFSPLLILSASPLPLHHTTFPPQYKIMHYNQAHIKIYVVCYDSQRAG